MNAVLNSNFKGKTQSSVAVKKPGRKVLKPNDPNVLLPSLEMGNNKGKASGESQKPKVDSEVFGKENTPVKVRRSKRKNVTASQAVLEIDSNNPVSKNAKTKVAKTKAAKTKVAKTTSKKVLDVVKESEALENLNQSTLDSYFSQKVPDQQDSKSSPASISDAYSVIAGGSISDEVAMLTSEVPTENYWKLLAEERRKALEVVLYENAQLSDQLEVLEVENGQLKSLLQQCEQTLEIVQSSLS